MLGHHKAAEAGPLDGVLVRFERCGPISLKPARAGAGSPEAPGPPKDDLQEKQGPFVSCWAPTTWAPTVSGADPKPAR